MAARRMKTGTVLLAIAATVLLVQPGAGQRRGDVPALAALSPGQWQLRDVDNAARPLPNLCLGDVGQLIQLEHRGQPCARIVIDATQDRATIHYTCPGAGFGRTTLRVDTPRLVRIDTQGLADNAPFAYRAEARRVGACPGRRR